MATDTIKLPSLFGGVSRQPPHLRFPNQVEDSSNALFSVVDGCSKRPGSWYLRTIANLSGTDFRLHRIIRDEGERYIVVYGPSTLRVFELGGPEATVTISAAAATYLAANSPTSDQLRLVSEVDSTFIVNTTVPAQVVAGDTYVVQDSWDDYDQMVLNTPSDGSYHALSAKGATADHLQGNYKYDVDGSTFATARFPDLTGFNNTSVYGLVHAGTCAFKVGFTRVAITITAGVWTVATKNLASTGAFVDYQDGDMIYVTGGTGVTAGWYTITAKNSNNDVTLSANIAASDNTDTTATFLGLQLAVTYSQDSTVQVNMEAVAAKWAAAFEAAGAGGTLVAWDGFDAHYGHFTVTSPFRGSGATIQAPTAPGSGTDFSATGKPFSGVGATFTAGTGPTLDFVPVSDRWSLAAASGGEAGQFVNTTMPIRMQRTAISSPHPNPTTPATFSVDVINWNERESGDGVTNPAPDPFKSNQKINDLRFYQDRMCLAMGEFVVMSAASDYYNFFLADALNIVDSDPVIVSLSAEEIAVIDFMVPYQKSLALFTMAGRQFQIGFTDVLKPGSAAITPMTAYTTLSVRPKTMGARLYFIAIEGYGSQVLEYGFDDQVVTGDAANITGHVPGYLPATLRTLEVSQNNQMALILPSGETRYTLYGYKTFWSGDQKQQSAWFTYDFDTGYFIADIVVVEDYCYVLVKKDSIWVLERFSLPQEPSCVPLEAVQ